MTALTDTERVALVDAARAEMARHDKHPFPAADIKHDHTDPDVELLIDASAVAGTVA